MLFMKAWKERSKTYFSLPFNPSGEGSDYRKAHSIPYRIFYIDNDESVLIGAELWNKIGDNKNTYSDLLELFNKVGEKYSDTIKKTIWVYNREFFIY
ncbi:TdeIII family type II restriction endonuclease [Clostridium tetani]|nr:TdeIII family type II restriction endonuclease [Clostridium tetani]QBD88493.1 TdeIII family type II restriction endonuclease [Clostridium tetani]RXI61522.1 TdeIII family type II restriction endonuclease [Clostridium tetani]RXI64920.1 TdeIII family type II restriction endonuclease [Clostridium tetani]RXI67301.1 TdeIII family type II restriction endonuclease [Clostridium tetani]